MSIGKCTGDEIFFRTETRSSASSRSGPRAAPADLPETTRSGRPAPDPDRQHPPGEHQRRQRGTGDRPSLYQRQQETGSSTGRRSSKEQQHRRRPSARRPPPKAPGSGPGRDPRSRSGPAPRTGSARHHRDPAEISGTPGRPPRLQDPAPPSGPPPGIPRRI